MARQIPHYDPVVQYSGPLHVHLDQTSTLPLADNQMLPVTTTGYNPTDLLRPTHNNLPPQQAQRHPRIAFSESQSVAGPPKYKVQSSFKRFQFPPLTSYLFIRR